MIPPLTPPVGPPVERPPSPIHRPLVGPAEIDHWRARMVEVYTVTAVHDVLDWPGQSALDRGDFAGVARALGSDPTSTLISLFLLGDPVPTTATRTALGTPTMDALTAAGLIEASVDQVRSAVSVRPLAAIAAPEPDSALKSASDPALWLVSDFGSDVRPGFLQPEHVLGAGAAAQLLAQSTYRPEVGRALDVGTGCGVQSLHLTRHAAAVTGTDISARALRFAATGAALAGVDVDLRLGSLLEPVAGEAFDLVVANPPFVISPGWDADHDGYTYRDSGLPGDAFCAQLTGGLTSMLTDGGTAQLLANWAITDSTDPGAVADRVRSWLPAQGVDAWVWQREVAEPGEYVSLWLRDAGDTPGTSSWRRRYQLWRDWLDQQGIVAIGMGLISLRRSDAGPNTVVCEDVVQAVEQPVGSAIGAWFDRARWLARTSDRELLQASLRPSLDLELQRRAALGPTGWAPDGVLLSQSGGVRWQLDTDDAIAGVVAACNGATPMSLIISLLADARGVSAMDVTTSLIPVVRDLIARGFLQPPTDRR